MIVSRHAQARFLCCRIEFTMETDRMIKTLRTKLWLWRLTQCTIGAWRINISPRRKIFLQLKCYFSLRNWQGSHYWEMCLLLMEYLFWRTKITNCQSWKLKTVGTYFMFLYMVICNLPVIFKSSFDCISNNTIDWLNIVSNIGVSLKKIWKESNSKESVDFRTTTES